MEDIVQIKKVVTNKSSQEDMYAENSKIGEPNNLSVWEQ